MDDTAAESEVPLLVIGVRVGVAYREVRLALPRIRIGRAAPDEEAPPEIDLTHDESVSRRHAEIRWIGDGYSIVDVGSTNGTQLNGERIDPDQPVRLKDGDRVALGRLSVLTVHFAGSHDAGSS